MAPAPGGRGAQRTPARQALPMRDAVEPARRGRRALVRALREAGVSAAVAFALGIGVGLLARHLIGRRLERLARGRGYLLGSRDVFEHFRAQQADSRVAHQRKVAPWQ